MSQESLEKRVTSDVKNIAKTSAIDTAANMSYSLVVGAALDCAAGLNVSGIIASRASASGMNAITAAPYGWWREQAYKATKTSPESSKLRKSLADLAAFNTFQVPIYGVALAAGSLLSEGHINWNKVRDGTAYLAALSPFIAPTVGLWTDFLRRMFHIKSAAEGSYRTNESDTSNKNNEQEQ